MDFYAFMKDLDVRDRNAHNSRNIPRKEKNIQNIQSIILLATFNQLRVFDDYIRHGDVAEFCVMTAISVMRETLLQFDI